MIANNEDTLLVPALGEKDLSSLISNLDLRVDTNVFSYSSSSEISITVEEVYKVNWILIDTQI